MNVNPETLRAFVSAVAEATAGGRRYALDLEPLSAADFAAFCLDNDLSPAEVEQIGNLDRGEEMTFGGGAVPPVVLTRFR